MDTLVSHATVVTMNDQMAVLPDAFVGVAGGKICYLSSEPPQEHPAQIIDATGLVMMPGLINAHTHLPMSILRGYDDDYPQATWLNDHNFPSIPTPPVRSWMLPASTGMALTMAVSGSRPLSMRNIPLPIRSGTHWENMPITTISACMCICQRQRTSTNSARSAMV